MSPASLPTRQLGKDGPQVTALGFGLMGLSVAYGPAPPDNERLALLDKAWEMGEHFWDSANSYGDSEDLLGKWFKLHPERRSDIFLATKFGFVFNAQGGFIIDSGAENCRTACETSLKRLGVDCIDLYYCHRVDGTTPIEQTVRAMVELKNEGKIKYLGLSECSAETLRRACKIHHIAAVQMEYSPFAIEIESKQFNFLQTARELGVAVIAYSPVGRGMLTGTIRSRADFSSVGDFRSIMPRWSDENFPKSLKLVDAIVDMAKNKNVTPSQLCLAWLLGQGDNIIPIPGTTKQARLEENLGALKVDLTSEEDQKIRKLSEDAEDTGDRYPEAFAAAQMRDTPEE